MRKFLFLFFSLMLHTTAYSFILIENPCFELGSKGWGRKSRNGCFYAVKYKKYRDKFKKANNCCLIHGQCFAISHDPDEWAYFEYGDISDVVKGTPLWAAATVSFTGDTDSVLVKMEIFETHYESETTPDSLSQVGRLTFGRTSSRPVKELLLSRVVEIGGNNRWQEISSDYPVYPHHSNNVIALRISFKSSTLGDLRLYSGQLATDSAEIFPISPDE